MRLPGFKTMLKENGKITLPIPACTWIGIAAYLGTLHVVVVGSLPDFDSLGLPELRFLLVGLTYTAVKSIRPEFISINEERTINS